MKNIKDSLSMLLKCQELVTSISMAQEQINTGKYLSALKVCSFILSIPCSLSLPLSFSPSLFLSLSLSLLPSLFLSFPLSLPPEQHHPQLPFLTTTPFLMYRRLIRSKTFTFPNFKTLPLLSILVCRCLNLLSSSPTASSLPHLLTLFFAINSTEKQLPLMRLQIKDSVKSEFSNWQSSYVLFLPPLLPFIFVHPLHNFLIQIRLSPCLTLLPPTPTIETTESTENPKMLEPVLCSILS